MGLSCSKFAAAAATVDEPIPSVVAASASSKSKSKPSCRGSNNKKKKKRSECSHLDPFMHDLVRRSLQYSSGAAGTVTTTSAGQHHLLFHKQGQLCQEQLSSDTLVHYPTRLVVRRRTARSTEEGMSGTHVYALRYPREEPLQRELQGQGQHQQAQLLYLSGLQQQEQCPERAKHNNNNNNGSSGGSGSKPVVPSSNTQLVVSPKDVVYKNSKDENVDHLFQRPVMLAQPKHKIVDWVTVSDEHSVYIADVGVSAADCDRLVEITEQACRGQYAAYTYAKQTLGCREFPPVAHACQNIVHTIVHAISEFSNTKKNMNDNKILFLDDREPHMVKYDVTKKERQKLDMHTDKSEWTFLIALSDGCGMDYEGGGTYFECLDATIHIQRGQALIFPGKLRHCGQRITSGLRFLLVGFLVDKNASAAALPSTTTTTTTTASKQTNESMLGGQHPTPNIPS